MEDEFYNLTVKGNDLKPYVRRFQELAVICPSMVPNTEKLLEAFIGGLPRSIEGNVIASKPQTLEEAINISQRLMDQVNKARGAQIHWGSLFGKSHNALGYSTFRCHPDFEGVTDWYQSQGYREPVTMSSATSDVTYTSVYTDSEPGRAFWGADDEEVSEGGIPRVIVLGYDGLPLQPVAPPSPDSIPNPEDPQTPPVPQDEDEREPMFIQAHDPDYVPEPIYPEYIPLEDDHEFPAEEQPLPPIDSPTTESPGYVTESDPEEDPEEYEDDETEDGPVDYPMDGGDDGDDDDGDSSRDDANDEDEDEEEEEHLAPADSTTVIPADEPVFPPEGTEPVIPPPSTDITIGMVFFYLSWNHGDLLTVITAVEHVFPPEGNRAVVPPPSTDIILEVGLPSTPNFHILPPERPEVEETSDHGLPDHHHHLSPVSPPSQGGALFARCTGLDDIPMRLSMPPRKRKTLWMVEEERPMLPARRGLFDRIELGDFHSGEASDPSRYCVHETRFQMQHAELAALRETDRRRQDPDVGGSMKRARSPEDQRLRIPDHQEASGDADSAYDRLSKCATLSMLHVESESTCTCAVLNECYSASCSGVCLSLSVPLVEIQVLLVPLPPRLGAQQALRPVVTSPTVISIYRADKPIIYPLTSGRSSSGTLSDLISGAYSGQIQPLAGRLLRLGDVIPTVNRHPDDGGKVVTVQEGSAVLQSAPPAEGGDSEIGGDGVGVVIGRSLCNLLPLALFPSGGNRLIRGMTVVESAGAIAPPPLVSSSSSSHPHPWALHP
ncbi:hypothetical protein Tco_0791924 [Tanacetum coccineum]